ncbi:PQQ-binding-like beta-propeller repeat protein [Zavarzinella formosa]|uniref:PQQ-binding-like beta-propeller repeat protein n=1 Tax=Zavarzinella formosa TaxID=360055 RepID=UPI0002E54529|nr:PQQ-binding-like beta-propeller repeat protein [Zavarzinella formosa]
MSEVPARPVNHFMRRFFPALVILIAGAVLVAIANWPGNQADASSLNMGKMLTVIIALICLFVWGMRFSGLKRLHVLLATLGVFLAFFACFKIPSMDGRFFPIIAPRNWVQDLFLGGSPETILENHRINTPKADVPAKLEIQENDWPEYRGGGRDGIVRKTTLSPDWGKNPPKELWRQPIGGGYAAFSVANGFLVTIEQRRDEEAVVCYQASTGREVWVCKWPTLFKEQLGGDGPRATPTIAHGDVFALGAKGRLVCVDGNTGTEKWAVETLENNQNIQWAMSGSPLVVDDLVIVNPGAQNEESKGKAVRAYNRKTGDFVWATGTRPAGYCSPELAQISGQRMILMLDATGLSGIDIVTGAELWRFGWPTYQGINVAQPLVIGSNRVCVSSGYNTGGVMLEVTQGDGGKWNVKEVWRTKTSVMRSKFMSPVVYENHAYGLNDGIMECVDLNTGKQVWKDERTAKRGEAYGHGQILLVQDSGLIVVLTEYGELALVRATPEKYEELGRIQALKRGKKTWNNPAMVGNIIYLRNEEEMAAYELAK